MKASDSRPRWKHVCPGCKRVIYWEKVYCLPCIAKEPQRDHFRLSSKQTWLKGRKLTGIERTRNHMFVVVGRKLVCVECGRNYTYGKLVHRCFSKLESYLRSRHNLKCAVCANHLPKALFPVVGSGKSLVKVMICANCLDGSNLVIVHRRVYKARKAAMM
jgi:hypothetical protein